MSQEPLPAADEKEYFSRIYKLYWNKIYRFSLYHVHLQEDAKEITQDIFLSLWDRRHHTTIYGNEENYLIKAAKYKVFDYYRRAQANPVSSEATAGCSENVTENQVLFNALTQRIEELMLFLPRQSRKIYQLSRETGLSNKDIASSLNISTKAVEYHITRTLRHLKDNLPEYAEHFS